MISLPKKIYYKLKNIYESKWIQTNKLFLFLCGKFSDKDQLTAYAKFYKTDKINQNHSFAGKNYLDIYNQYFSPLRSQQLTLLEIGIREGASLRTFRDYFSNGTVLGLDINPETEFTEKRIKSYIGSQSSTELIDKIFNEHPKINIVIDDGSHINELTLASFKLIFNRLERGGLYILEDLLCTYLEDELQSGIEKGGWPGMHLNDPNLEIVNRRVDMDVFFQQIIKDLDSSKGEIEFIHFWNQTCVIKKVD